MRFWYLINCFSNLGCNEACKDEYGCLHKCSRSPTGPFCYCLSNQTLGADNKSCFEVRHQPVHYRKLKVGLIVAGVVGLVLVMVIILVTFKYQQAKVQSCFYKLYGTGLQMSTM